MSSGVSMTGMMALGALVAQNTAIALMMRLAATGHSGFLPSTAVCCDEALKLFVCVLIMVYYYVSMPEQQGETQPLSRERAGSFRGFCRFLTDELCGAGVMEWAKMCVPALLYTIQKNLLYLALANLHAVVYQVTSQSKILTTAVFSYMILGRNLSCSQVLALFLLGGGVATVQLSAFNERGASPSVDSDANPLLGIAAVLVVSCTSGFSSVYFEYMLKKSGPATEWSLWVRNIQLASFALPIALVTAFAKDGSVIVEKGFLHGYLPVTWVVVALEALGGIFVALVTKYADSILKNFATALAIVVSATFCAIYMGFHVTRLFSMGAAMVLLAVFLYNHVPAVAPAKMRSNSTLSSGYQLEGGKAAAKEHQ